MEGALQPSQRAWSCQLLDCVSEPLLQFSGTSSSPVRWAEKGKRKLPWRISRDILGVYRGGSSAGLPAPGRPQLL